VVVPCLSERFPWTYPFERTLLIKEPWASLVAEGLKTWELRRSTTDVRGVVGLTPTGSGVIGGRAHLVEVHGPFTAGELREHRDKHLVNDESLEAYAAGRPLFAWEFRDVQWFASPAEYQHP
jgi:hypothetical protein